MRTLGLCLIVKDEAENIERLLESVRGVVDAVYLTDTGSTDDTVKIAEKVSKRLGLKLEVSHFKWVDNFSKARNFNFRQAKTDWILWMDGDDTLENGEKLRKEIEAAELSGATGIIMNYNYQEDDEGNNLNDHDKLRVVKNGFYSWTHETAGEVPIHENLFPLPGVEAKDMYSREVFIKHWIGKEGMLDSQARNLRILKQLEKEEGDNPDPRTVFLLGRELDGQQMYDEAIPYLEKFTKLQGTQGETLHACSMLAKIFERKGQFQRQLEWAYKGIMAHPTHPLGYLRAAEAYKNRGEWQNVVDMIEVMRTKKVSKMDTLSFTDFSINKPGDLELANAYNELGEYDKAKEIVEGIISKLTKDEYKFVQPAFDQIIRDSNRDKQKRALRAIANSLIAENRLKELPKLVEMAPMPVAHTKPVTDIKRVIGLNKLWNKGNIVIYATVGIEPWDEASLEKGIGGSETAVVEMAKRFGKAGYHVTVYGDVNERSDFGNVTYLPASQIEWADEFDIFISWRNLNVFKEVDIHANKKYLWLHDVVNPADFTKDVVNKIDKIIVLSEYHRSLIPDVHEERIYVSRNGIDTDLIDSLRGKIERNPLKVIYASQPVRGLENLLDIWKEVKEEVPEAELVWAYGWDNFELTAGRTKNGRLLKERLQTQMRMLGVKELGRLGKEDLYKEFLSSGIWAYPTEFPEISCIVATEAQACGCYPISTGFAALAETQEYGDKINVDEFRDVLIKRLKGIPPTRVTSDFGWNTLADEWMNDLFYGVEWEDQTPKVSIVNITAREGGIKMLADTVKRQSYKNIELIVIDKLYDKRKDKVAEELSKLDIPFIHLPDPPRDEKTYPYGLAHAHNAALAVANGDLIVFVQDWFSIPEDGIEKFVNLYLHHPDKIYTGIDEQYQEETKFKTKVWESMWRVVGKGRRISANPREWETCWAAAPKAVLEKLGGWNVDWDKGHGWDNVDVAFRHIEMGGLIVVDEDNVIKGFRHEREWQSDPESDNGTRFVSYARAIQESSNPRLVMKFEFPEYGKEFKEKIKSFKLTA